MERSPKGAGWTRPVELRDRITSLDLVRGVAVLGILVMNVVSYGLGAGPYFNLSAGGSQTWLDWLIGGFGEVFVDQKFMGLFSLLFGAGIALFCDRAAKKTPRPALLCLWRNLLLLGIGFLHLLLWEGDILIGYALVSPIVILLHNRKPRLLFLAGGVAVALSPLAALLFQAAAVDGSGLGGFWSAAGEVGDLAEAFMVVDFFSRGMGMMLIGAGLYRNGVITGDRYTSYYRRTAAIGLGTGVLAAAIGLAWVVADGFTSAVALIGTIPNTLGTVPAALGYAALIVLWNRQAETWLHRRLRAVGRMALTNYLTQTLLGVLVLRLILADVTLTRTMLAGFVMVVWAVQVWWSAAWFNRFRFGPAEWLWRVATYLQLQPLRRSDAPSVG